MKHDSKLHTRLKEDVLLERLALIEREIDTPEATKVKQLIHKLMTGEQHFLFSGHFSAGKSSLINALFDTKLLPSSPIPASANTVRVRSGEPGASVHFLNGKKMVFQAPYDIEVVKGYCLNGEEVERVELSSPSMLNQDVILIDTPGIDSTDEAHRLSTESSMYLADVVFYVMDYNHVQAEVNYQFIRELYRQNKKVILIVNQIDKHKESELSFKSFQRSVVESFETWGISLESFFFISLRDLEHPHNQFNQLKSYIEGLSDKTTEEKVKRVYDAAVELLADVTAVQVEDDDVNEAFNVMQHTLSNSNERIDLVEEEFQVESSKIIKSANLMPYEVREAGRAYLESLQPGFKVGFIFREKKTEQERNARYQAFIDGLQEQVKSQLEWHFHQLLQQLVETAKVEQVDLYEEPLIADFSVIQEEANKGTGASGEAVLHYTENIANLLKSQMKQQAERVKDDLLKQVKKDHEQTATKAEASFKEMVGEKAAATYLARVKIANRKYEDLWSIMSGDHDEDATHAAERIKQWLKSGDEEVVIIEPVDENHVRKRNQPTSKKKQIQREELSDRLPSTEETALALYDIASQLDDLPGFEQTKSTLINKAAKMKDKSYTVALFGAFSAGKSSFANALIGETILPSSPNPTTATLNRICPVSNQHPHKTAIIYYKTEEELLEDLKHSLSYFGEQAFSIQDSLQIIATGKIFKRESADTKPHALFLRAVLEGESEIEYLGNEREVSLEEYKDMVVNESKAGFISSISLFYDCPLTTEGITLVDTPGADSINARHTGVAFQYMKSADAILYVTYYNHAFSKADREFLIQLGRVKDVFELDKMFFLLNAADLAEDEEELQVVLDHVTHQLQQYGIRQPSLYPVSSLAGMLEGQHNLNQEERRFLDGLPDKLKKKGGVEDFEARFYQFIRSDLSKLAVEANLYEINRVQQLIEQWLLNYELDSSDKEKQLQRIKVRAVEAKKELSNYAITSSQKSIQQELTELVHYIPQRLFYRFNDFFKEAFNPSVVSSREDLINASSSLLEDIEQDILQELRAASLRIDRFIKRELQKNEKDIQMIISYKLSEFRYSGEGYKDMETPAFAESLSSWLQIDDIQKKARSVFKSQKQFFEQNGRSQLHDDLKDLFNQPVNDYLKTEQQVLQDSAIHYYEQMVWQMKDQVDAHITNHVESSSYMLTSTINKEVLEEKEQQVEQIKTNLLGE
ncbi:dynamin family GTPase [Bacillus sp. NTK071]|uniref:dynamin family protein n=1 Tax=Bacillus sp. NTK071 TaxID=2802175 RepID=UPI001A8D1A44|nr:dynamin family protein [Bacillus sp. NTK071]MBN8207583.1 dynamin family GTPase [Bacillus sp. NTK071]